MDTTATIGPTFDPLSPEPIYRSDNSIESVCSTESYTTNQEDTDWCAAHSTSRLLAKLIMPPKFEIENEDMYKSIGKCLLDWFTQTLDKKSPFLYDTFIHNVIGAINTKTFSFHDVCSQFNKYIYNKRFKVYRITNPDDGVLSKLPKILSIGGTKQFFEIFSRYKDSTASDRGPDSREWVAYNKANPNQVDKPFGHSLFLKSYKNGELRIKDADGYGYFNIPYILIKPAIKEIIYLKKQVPVKSAKGIHKSKRRPVKNTRKNNKKHY
jgi:hypothetical protein